MKFAENGNPGGRTLMKNAERIMKSKAFIKAEMDQTLPKTQSDELWRKATERLASILEQYRALPKGMRGHTDHFIFPSAAVYLTAKETLGEKAAYQIIENAAVGYTEKAGRKLAALMKLPGMRGLFVRIWDPLTKKKFGLKNGFQNRFYPKETGVFRMDILACPYCRYFGELGCPELTKIYCANDDRVYGKLPGLRFERAETLGTGADRCDFCIRKETI